MKKDILSLLPESVKMKGSFRSGDILIDGIKLSPKASLKVLNRSPEGFLWGYSGAAPAQLALAILLKYLPEKVARTYFLYFKSSFVATLPKTDFVRTVNLRKAFKEMLGI